MIKGKSKFVQTTFETEELGAIKHLMQDTKNPLLEHPEFGKAESVSGAGKRILVPTELEPAGSITGTGNRIINCSDDKSETITLKEGDFKKIKNFDPADNIAEYLGLNSSDKIIFDAKSGSQTHYFVDDKSGVMYAFMTDKNDKITSGAIVEFSGGSASRSGVIVHNVSSSVASPEYKVDDKDREAIKAYLKDKIKDHSGALEVTQVVSKPELLDAVGGLASTNSKVGSNFKTSGAGFDKGSNSIG